MKIIIQKGSLLNIEIKSYEPAYAERDNPLRRGEMGAIIFELSGHTHKYSPCYYSIQHKDKLEEEIYKLNKKGGVLDIEELFKLFPKTYPLGYNPQYNNKKSWFC